ncbi:MAG: beta-lactamase family protein [candidate division WOR-3 bacterium]|nr:MAG: beta-lactamase family protein [candidate division WOR-3 bacterium]
MKLLAVVFAVSLLFVASNAQPVAPNTENAMDESKRPDAAREMVQDMREVKPFPTLVRYDSAGLDALIRNIMTTEHVPGVATWCSKDGQVIWQQNYGYARLEDSMPVTNATIWTLMSISKTVTGSAIMQLWERGEFDLDDDVNDYLPFDVRNPRFPDIPITFRMLMTHTSSIRDNGTIHSLLWIHGDSPVPLGEYLENYLVPGGIYYQRYNYDLVAPGTNYEYSNAAISLLGYLVEVIEDSFPVHCQDSIFQPLRMNKTSWFLADLNAQHLAMGYEWKGSHYDSTGLWGMPYYPAASLRANVRDLAQHLTVMLQYGTLGANRILNSATVELMLTPHFTVDPTYWKGGLTWHYQYYLGRWLWFHDGGSSGYRTLYGFCPAEGSAFIVLTNASSELNVIVPIAFALMDYALEYNSEIASESGVQEGISRSYETQDLFPTILRGPLQLPKNTSYKVFDITGRVVMPETMKPGIYFIGTDDHMIQKVIKVK